MKTTCKSWQVQKFRAVCHTHRERESTRVSERASATRSPVSRIRQKRARAIQANLLTSRPNLGQFEAALTENVCNWERLWRHFKLAVWVSVTDVLAHRNFLSFSKSLPTHTLTEKYFLKENQHVASQKHFCKRKVTRRKHAWILKLHRFVWKKC